MSTAQERLMQVLREDGAAVEAAMVQRAERTPALAAFAKDESLSLLFQAQNYSLMAGGKRIRPVLTIESCRALGGTLDAALPFACAIEMVHTYSLIHDDLPCMDNDDLRRGKPTNHKVFGQAMAVLAGDGLLTDAFSVITAHQDVEIDIRLAAVEILAAAAGSIGMVGGQVMDMQGEHQNLSCQTLEQLHARKTGALICVAVQLGALAAGVTPHGEMVATWDGLTEYAKNLGLAFQVVDDILDVTADPILLGKTKGKDRAAEKTTFLNHYTVEEATEYVCNLTENACDCIRDIDRNGVLRALAHYLAQRVY